MKRKPAIRQDAFHARSGVWIILLLLAIIFVIVFVFTFEEEEKVSQDNLPPRAGNRFDNPLQLELPAQKPGDHVVVHTAYTLSYNEEHEQANWVAYTLRKSEGRFQQRFARSNNFTEDSEVPTGTAAGVDYESSGYDRGHLVPAEDLSWSKKSMEESFLYSNVSPQLPSFNRGVWRRLEELIRFWADEYDSVYVVTGPVLNKRLPAIGANKVSVPQYYYKAVLHYNPKETKCIGFVLSHKPSAASLKSFAVPVDSVEQLTGLDLFTQLPDKLENNLEQNPHIESWPWIRRKKK